MLHTYNLNFNILSTNQKKFFVEYFVVFTIINHINSLDSSIFDLIEMFQSHSYQPIPDSDEDNNIAANKRSYGWRSFLSVFVILCLLVSTLYKLFSVWNIHVKDFDSETNFYEATIPFSTLSPVNLGVIQIERTESSKPSEVFGELRSTKLPLPTNSWCENFFLGQGYKTDETNKVFQLPYVIEAHDYVKGVKTHPVRVQSNDRTVMMIYEPENGLAMGAMETFLPQHEIAPDKNLAVGRLSVVLQWKSPTYKDTKRGPMMYTPIVRGSPYTSMVYSEATPRIYVQRSVSSGLVVDNDHTGEKLVCGNGHNIFSEKPILVKKELRLQFDISDMTWLLFVSEPTEFICSSKNLTNFVHDTTIPGWEEHEPHFEVII